MRSRSGADLATLVLAGLLALGGVVELQRLGSQSAAIDFYTVWTMAQAVGRADLSGQGFYSPEVEQQLIAEMQTRVRLAGQPPRLAAAVQASTVLEPTASPFLYAVFGPLARSTYEQDHRRYRWLSLLSLLVGVLALARLAGLGAVTGLLLLASITWLCEPVASEVRVGNVNFLQVAGLATYLTLLRGSNDSWWRILLAGAVGAALAWFKPSLAPVPLACTALWCGQRRWERVMCHGVGLVAASVLCVALPVLRFAEARIWWQWWQRLSDSLSQGFPVAYGNFSLPLWLAERLGLGGPGLLSPLLSLLIPLGFVVVYRFGRSGAAADGAEGFAETRAAGLVVALTVTASAVAWQHYFVLFLPLVALALGDLARRTWSAGLIVMGWLVLCLRPWSSWLEWTDPSAQAPWMVLGQVLVVLGAWLALLHRDPGSVASRTSE